MDLQQMRWKMEVLEYTSWTLTATERRHIFLQENYAAEVEALIHTANMISTSEVNCSHVAFLTDALSALQALENNKLDRLSEALHPISSVSQVVLQWIPAHCGIPGNENADRLAKLGAAKE